MAWLGHLVHHVMVSAFVGHDRQYCVKIVAVVSIVKLQHNIACLLTGCLVTLDLVAQGKYVK